MSIVRINIPDDEDFEFLDRSLLAANHEPLPLYTSAPPTFVEETQRQQEVQAGAPPTVTFWLKMTNPLDEATYGSLESRTKAKQHLKIGPGNDGETLDLLSFPDPDVLHIAYTDQSTGGSYLYGITATGDDNSWRDGVVRFKIKLPELNPAGRPHIAIGIFKFR